MNTVEEDREDRCPECGSVNTFCQDSDDDGWGRYTCNDCDHDWEVGDNSVTLDEDPKDGR